MIPQTFIEEVQSRADIVELVSSYIPLKRAGRNFKALCPFHGEKTSSFVVSPQKQIFHCFGCGEGGGAFQFLMLIEKINFPEAVEILAKKMGLDIPYEKTKSGKTKSAIYEVMSQAAKFFHNNLSSGRSNQVVLQYLGKRGIGEKTIAKFLIGYAEGNKTLINYMRNSGVTLDLLEKASLAISGRDGFRDLFSGRIIFPIFDVRSRVIGFGARTYKELPNSPKYINSLESSVYSKREHLFGLNFSKDEITKKDEIIITEGYLDMITPFMRGVSNIVASLGTAITQEQIRLIKRYASSVTLAYDSDKAGEKATLRALDLLLENNLKVKVINLPTGGDPDSLLRSKGKDYFFELLGKRQDFFEYKLEILKKEYDIDNIDGKGKVAREMLATIGKVNSEIEKYAYIKRLADNLKVKEEIMIAEFQNNFSKMKQESTFVSKGVSSGKQQDPNDKGVLSVTEKVFFKFIFNNPKVISSLSKSLKKDYFSLSLTRRVVEFLVGASFMEGIVSPQELLRAIDNKEISSFVSEILMNDEIPLDRDLFKESLMKIREKGKTQVISDLKNKIKEAEASGDGEKLKGLINQFGKIRGGVRNG